MTPEVAAEARAEYPLLPAHGTKAEPISADEVLGVHEILTGWEGGLVDLLESQPEVHH